LKLKACDMHQDMEDKTDEEREDNRFAWKMRKRAMIQATEVCLCYSMMQGIAACCSECVGTL